MNFRAIFFEESIAVFGGEPKKHVSASFQGHLCWILKNLKLDSFTDSDTFFIWQVCGLVGEQMVHSRRAFTYVGIFTYIYILPQNM